MQPQQQFVTAAVPQQLQGVNQRPKAGNAAGLTWPAQSVPITQHLQLQQQNDQGGAREPAWPQPIPSHGLAWAQQHPGITSIVSMPATMSTTTRPQTVTHLQSYVETPTYYDVSSLSAPSQYTNASMQPQVSTVQTRGREIQQSTMQQQTAQPSAADHLLSQLVNAAAASGPGNSSHSSNAILLSNQMAGLSMQQAYNTMPHQPHIQQQQQQQLELLLDSDGDVYTTMTSMGTGNATNTMDLLSSGSLSNLLGGDGQPGAAPGTSASLYVKNLSPDADELYLYQKFAPHGALLSCKVKSDPATGKCRGVGFVNYVEQACALRAMQQLHGSRTAEGRQLHITLQAPRAVRAAAAAATATTVSPRADPNSTLHEMVSSSQSMNMPTSTLYLTHPPMNSHLPVRPNTGNQLS